MNRSLFAVLFSLTSLTACVEPDDVTTEETSSALSTANWSTVHDPNGQYGYTVASATLGGYDYYVFTYGAASEHDLYWKRCDTVSCTALRRITGQQTSDRVSLAAFNGYLYMVHVGESDSWAVWFSRFNPASEQWSTNVRLNQFAFNGPPALAAFNNQLYMVGTSERTVFKHGIELTTYPMWFVTMNAAEVFSTPRDVNRESASQPSLAAFNGRLYLAHQYGATSQIAYNTLVPNSTSWSQDVVLKNGTTPFQGHDVQIAQSNGFLHLVYQRSYNNYTYWTYFDGCTWAPDLTIDARQTTSPLSMSTSVSGVALSRMEPTPNLQSWFLSRFQSPPPPLTAPLCLPNAG